MFTYIFRDNHSILIFADIYRLYLTNDLGMSPIDSEVLVEKFRQNISYMISELKRGKGGTPNIYAKLRRLNLIFKILF